MRCGCTTDCISWKHGQTNNDDLKRLGMTSELITNINEKEYSINFKNINSYENHTGRKN